MKRWPAATAAVLRRPDLWSTAARQLRVLAPGGWWRRAPFLPLPDRDWLAFRMTTAYGDSDVGADPQDLVAWLEWTRDRPGGHEKRRRRRNPRQNSRPSRPRST